MSNFDNSDWATLTLNEALELGKNPQYSLSPKEITVIGRSPDCQIVLDSHQYITVSRRHAEIKLTDSNWEIRDLGTTNGTLVNGDKIKGSNILASGDRIVLGLKGPEFSFECVTLNATVMVNLTEVEVSIVASPEQPLAPTANPTPLPKTISSAKAITPNSLPVVIEAQSDTPETNKITKILTEAPPQAVDAEISAKAEIIINLEQPVIAKIPTTSERLSNVSTSSKNLWNLISLTPLGELSGHEAETLALAFSYDGRVLASAGADKTIKLWNLVSKEQIVALPVQKLAVNALAFSYDGQTLASAGADKTIKLWNLNTQAETANLKSHKLAINALAFSYDGQTLASAGADKTIKLWNLNTQEEIASLVAHKMSVDALAFSPDGQTLASAGKDKTIKLWNIASQEETASLSGHKQNIATLSFSPDGQTIASVGANESIKLWNFTTREEIIAIATTSWEATSVAIAPDGQVLALSDQQGKIKLYQI